MILGLTGSYCAGKNMVARILEEQGWHCIDVDTLGHEALAACIDEVSGLLGPAVVNPDGTPNRKAIGAAVFADPALLARYEAIVHPAMFRLCEEKINHAASRGNKICINAMILYKMPQAVLCDAILELKAPLCRRIARGMKRDGLSMRRIMDRINRQKPLLKKGGLFAAKRIRLSNDGSASALRKKVLALLESLSPASGRNPQNP